MGFEPTEVSPSSVFKTDAIGHSANLPYLWMWMGSNHQPRNFASHLLASEALPIELHIHIKCRALFRQPLFGTRCEPSYIGRNKEWEVCMVNAQPLNHSMIIPYIETFVNYLLKCLQFCNNYIHQLYFEFVCIALQQLESILLVHYSEHIYQLFHILRSIYHQV